MQPVTPSTLNAGAHDALAASFATSYAGVVAFITVAAEGSFAKAGQRLGIGRSAVSRGVQRLEGQLGVRLLSRTTRSVSLTREGELFHARCQPSIANIVQAMDDLRDLRDGPPRGLLRIASPVDFGRRIVAPLLGGFRVAQPRVEVELMLGDTPPDFTADRVDVAFRNGRLEDSRIIARQIVPMQLLVCAAPGYLAAHGQPQSPEDLLRHACIAFRHASGRLAEWEFSVDGTMHRLTPRSRLVFNDAELVLQAVLQGQGLAQLAGYQACQLLREGRLVACMPQFAPFEGGHFISYLSREHLAPRVRAFVDHMTTAIRALELDCAAAMIEAAQSASSTQPAPM